MRDTDDVANQIKSNQIRSDRSIAEPSPLPVIPNRLGDSNSFRTPRSIAFAFVFLCVFSLTQANAQSTTDAKNKFSDNALKSAELISSVISIDEGGYSSSFHDVSSPVVGSLRTFRIRLENKSSGDFVFAKSSQQCNCLKIEPEEGVIPAGKSFDVVAEVRVPGRIASSKMESTIFLGAGSKDSPTHLVRFTYAFPEYVGFPVNLVELQVTESQLSAPVEFRVPLVFGGNIPVKDIDVILSQADTLDRPGFNFKIDDGILIGSLDLSKTSLATGAERLCVSMIVGRKSNDQIESIPIVVEKIDDIRIFPKFVSFKKESNGEWRGTLHLRCHDSFTGGVVEDWSCSAMSNEQKVAIELRALSKNIGKAIVTLPKDFRISKNGSLLGSEKATILISVKTNDREFKLKVFGLVPVAISKEEKNDDEK